MAMTVRIAISMGDPTGIGPEIILKALQTSGRTYQAVVYGVRQVFDKIRAQLACPYPEEHVEWHLWDSKPSDALSWGTPDQLAGEMQIGSLEAALNAVLEGKADALCTAPITKAAAKLAGFPFPGHTEFLADRTHCSSHVMMLAGPVLRVVPLTGHVPLCEVATKITAEVVSKGIVATARGLFQDFGIPRPKVAVAGLNPHAGEGGMLGKEEQRVIVPGIKQAEAECRQHGLEVELRGPYPADALFVPPISFDAVICGYHDQALIPLKMLHRDQGVNITLGLPIVRTSPAHGSAPDIAGKGIAKADSMIAALEMAWQVALRRKRIG